ncbi:hypothetical protein MMC24_000834 [Lignoscripta atroalba]|nr:hypothetical protein [Lignoscripta atroalba]
MESIRSAILPLRLTQLFADTKRSYENVVQTNHEGPQLSFLHLKLHIQKDRLIAWGLEWSDANAAHTGDIDGSLGRAGIGDLVASIMSSIRELLDEAEGLQPPQDINPMGNHLDAKAGGGKSGQDGQWTADNLRRLEEILKDLTTSIDTLCDLSRPRVEEWKQRAPTLVKGDKHHSLDVATPQAVNLIRSEKTSPPGLSDKNRDPSPPPPTGLIALTRIHPYQLRVRTSVSQSGSSPPSYESVAAGSEDRLLAYYTPQVTPESHERLPLSSSAEVPVLLDYGFVRESETYNGLRPDRERYEELSAALQRYSEESEPRYSGLLKLVGWTVDSQRARCAYVYEVPISQDSKTKEIDLQPRSLLSFLQNGADTDSSNMPSLENRFRLAFHVASSLQRLHAKGVKHRNVNSNNIVFFTNGVPPMSSGKVWKSPVIRKPYLIAFDQTALETSSLVEESTCSSIYRHPLIGEARDDDYTVAYDYYSLGLILLETGVWMPLGKFWKSKYTRADFKARLQDVYLKKLSAKCGNGYMRAVLFCLTAADQKSKNLGLDFTKGNQIQQQNSLESDFYWKVMKPLERCCMIDSTDRFEPLTAPPHSCVTHMGSKTNGNTEEHGPTEASVQKSASIAEQQLSGRLKSTVGKLGLSPQRKVERRLPSRPKIKVWSHEIPTLYQAYWKSEMLPKLDRILSKAINRWESLDIELFMAGEEPDTARPTIYVECLSTDKVQRILRHLNKDLRLFEIKVVSGQLVRSKAGKKKRKKMHNKPKPCLPDSGTGSQKVHVSDEFSNPHYQPYPTCGASLGAFRDNKHLPAVSFGGTVLVGGEPYGMSVHHMLEDDDDLELCLDERIDLRHSMASRQPFPLDLATTRLSILDDVDQRLDPSPFDMSDDEDDQDCSSIGDASSEPLPISQEYNRAPFEPLYPFEISEDEENNDLDHSSIDGDFWLSPNFEARVIEEDDGYYDVTLGDTLGVDAGQGRELIITQPAIDDVGQTFFPIDEDRDEEHLSSHTLGHIYASSGIKRSRKEGLVHEIDWALIKVHESRLQTCNIIKGGGRHCDIKTTSAVSALLPTPSTTISPLQSHVPNPENSYPTTTIPTSQLSNLHVHALGRTSGLQTGTILPTMNMVRLPGRTSLSHSWQVLGNFGRGGDSGAWVIDNASGQVAGHVLGYSTKKSVACIAPMEVLLEDMRKMLGTTVELPGLMTTSGISLEPGVIEGGREIAATIKTKDGDFSQPEQDLASESINGDDTLKTTPAHRIFSPALPTSPPIPTPTRTTSSTSLHQALSGPNLRFMDDLEITSNQRPSPSTVPYSKHLTANHGHSSNSSSYPNPIYQSESPPRPKPGSTSTSTSTPHHRSTPIIDPPTTTPTARKEINETQLRSNKKKSTRMESRTTTSVEARC